MHLQIQIDEEEGMMQAIYFGMKMSCSTTYSVDSQLWHFDVKEHHQMDIYEYTYVYI